MPEERWLTYAEAAQLLGRSTEAIRALVRREKWPRRIPNDYGSPTLILVPTDRLPPTVNGGHELADGGSDGHNDQGGHQGGDGDVDPERTIPVMLLTMQQM